ncbi:hypothetical protein [Brevundimonas diminuta]|uniref:hypothetical protein n=1 Tax=Brevundimonas diminuta TaxID=293 RepID=UPI0030FC9066
MIFPRKFANLALVRWQADSVGDMQAIRVNSMLDDVAQKDRLGSGAAGSGSDGEYIFNPLTS